MNTEVSLSTNEIAQAESTYGSGAYNPQKVALVRGKGTRVWDSTGKEYFDCGTGIGVAVLGHAHPVLVEAVSDQISTLATSVNGYFHNDIRSQFYEKLVNISPTGLSKVFICNSGTEAVECALKLARVNTGRTDVISALRGFHGRTMGSLSATANPKYQEPFKPLVPGFSHVPFGDIDALKSAITKNTAAILLEPIQGEAGIYPAPDGYLQDVRNLCDQNGTLLILDEIQSGMGRTGTWFASEYDKVVPDIICLAKALGAGMPIGATIFKENLVFGKGQHGSTFGGNPLACRAGLAVIDTIQNDALLNHISEVGSHFKSGLEAIANSKSDKVSEIRGRGLMLAIQLRGRAGKTLSNLMNNGVLAVASGSTIIRMLAPYIISQPEVDEVLQRLEDSIE
jgi:acetylornithine/LysW-gamma-L-lysine aminotransferase